MKNSKTRDGYKVVVGVRQDGDVDLNLIMRLDYSGNRFSQLTPDNAKRVAYALLLAADKVDP